MTVLSIIQLRAVAGGNTEDPPECDASCQAYNTGHQIGEYAETAGRYAVVILRYLLGG